MTERMSDLSRYAFTYQGIAKKAAGEWVRFEDAQAAIKAAVEAKAARVEAALHEISLCSQNSTSSKDECGRIAQVALQEPEHDY